MTEEEFLKKHLPPGADGGHEVLYDFDRRFHLSPTTQELTMCLVDLLPFLQAATIGPDLYIAGHDASELVLFLLARAKERGTSMPSGTARDAVVQECLRLMGIGQAPRLLPFFRNNDAAKRLRGILELLGIEVKDEG
jgi:hypothetical protein